MTNHSGNNLIDPHILFDKVRLEEGAHIADFGCGRTGHVVFPGSKIVGEKGIVYAVDILKDVLESIQRRAAIEAIHNIETVWADLERKNGVSIAPKTLDIGFFINVLFHFKDYSLSLGETARILKRKGRIVIVDWIKPLATLGPSEGEMVDFEVIKKWAQSSSFVIQENFKVGSYHQGMILFRHN